MDDLTHTRIRLRLAVTIVMGATPVIAGVPWTCSGCAGVTHRPLRPDDGLAGEMGGIPYLGTSLYLLLYSDGAGGVRSKILELPDPTKPMVAEPWAFLSRLELDLEFRDGALRRTGETASSTAVPDAILEAASSVARSAWAALNVPAGEGWRERRLPAPRMYKIIVRGGEIEFVGGAGDAPIRVRAREECAS